MVDALNSWRHESFKENAEYADSSQRAQKQADMCHLRPTLPGYDTMSACDFKIIKVHPTSWYFS